MTCASKARERTRSILWTIGDAAKTAGTSDSRRKPWMPRSNCFTPMKAWEAEGWCCSGDGEFQVDEFYPDKVSSCWGAEQDPFPLHKHHKGVDPLSRGERWRARNIEVHSHGKCSNLSHYNNGNAPGPDRSEHFEICRCTSNPAVAALAKDSRMNGLLENCVTWRDLQKVCDTEVIMRRIVASTSHLSRYRVNFVSKIRRSSSARKRGMRRATVAMSGQDRNSGDARCHTFRRLGCPASAFNTILLATRNGVDHWANCRCPVQERELEGTIGTGLCALAVILNRRQTDVSEHKVWDLVRVQAFLYRRDGYEHQTLVKVYAVLATSVVVE
ncbi:hypothetical protein B0H17DRAFT_1147297 [Mycena rosella]|uniref:Uncharacterized protein n=1 Tax=Mycena rosella TaxID=1033263 RepID=A0AAD7CPH0_MYCRO|nr:hypothetical protein B0H17DRAFT_1147297 [Mycena rosella]